MDLFFSVLSFFPEILELTTEILVLDFLLDLNVIWAIPFFFFFVILFLWACMRHVFPLFYNHY